MSSNAWNVARRTRIVPPYASRPLIAVVFEGLSEERKQLPSTLLYDAEGTALFEQACAQPEYYATRAEAELLRRHGPEIAEFVGPQAALVEYGSGAGRVGGALLAALSHPHAYVPIDTDATQLARARAEVLARLETLRVQAVCQDPRQFVALPSAAATARRCVALLPGGSVGAVRPLEAVAQLNTIREAMAAHGGLIVGVDLLREPAAHVRAYDDAAGAMARFNRHILARLNREIDATFELDHFAHRAAWNAERQRVEMSLVSTRTQSPTVAGIGVALGAGEDILTAVSHKYTFEGFASLARIAGWISRAAWVNDEQSFALAYLEAE